MEKEQTKLIVNKLREKGLRYEEIAVKLDVSIDTVRRWIYRGHKPNPYHERKIKNLIKKFNIEIN